MKLKDYLKDHLLFYVLYCLLILIIIFSLLAFKVNRYLIYYIPSLMIIIVIVYYAYDYKRRKKFYNSIKDSVSNLDQKYLTYELTDNPSYLEGMLMKDILYDICKNANEYVKEYQINQNEFKDYLESWCHEIKTPVSIAKMIIENNHNNITDSIDEEINRIDKDVEQVLFLARSEYVAKDYLISEVSLKDCINNVIKRNKKALIGNKIKIELVDVDVLVQTDSKWIEFIINQIILNSIKYISDNPVITIRTFTNKDNIILSINDNGMGILDSELSRVFDKGFTGSKGRNNNQATGMGLYICKKLCLRLQHHIYIDNKNGTTVSIVFPMNSYNRF